MKSSIQVKRQSFEIRLNSVISFVFVAFCQPRILRYSARDVTDIFAILTRDLQRAQEEFWKGTRDKLSLQGLACKF